MGYKQISLPRFLISSLQLWGRRRKTARILLSQALTFLSLVSKWQNTLQEMDFISVAVLGVFLPQSPFSWLFQKPKEVSCWPCFILKTSLQKWINKSLKGSTGIEKAKKIYFYNNKEVKSLSWLDSNLSLFWHWFFSHYSNHNVIFPLVLLLCTS